MKTSSLTSKLDKLKVSHTVRHINEHNKALDFTINGKKISADFTATSEEIQFFTTVIGYDQSEQEYQRLFFYSSQYMCCFKYSQILFTSFKKKGLHALCSLYWHFEAQILNSHNFRKIFLKKEVNNNTVEASEKECIILQKI